VGSRPHWLDCSSGPSPRESATSVRTTGRRRPFVEAKEALGGYYVIEASDLDHAVEIAKLCPAPGGGVEVRPVVDPTAANPF
jgi:hypothetical protein